MIPITKPFLPELIEFQKYLIEIWENNILTNNGPLLIKYEKLLKNHLKTNNLLLVNNGTTALQLAIKALGLNGEIITTPFSYVATTSSIVWEGCNPIFVDINPKTFNIDYTLIEDKITSKTKAILATHCFGNSCNIYEIEKIAKKHKLKVIYDASHCFGTNYDGKSIFNFGDISTLSLHSTKLVHCVEGGCLIANSIKTHEKLKRMRNFGYDGPDKFNEIGINGKNSEFHAAMGLSVLEKANEILASRKKQSENYDYLLKNLDLQFIEIEKKCDFNYAYYPIVFKSEKILYKVLMHLKSKNIFVRRYFYPLLSDLNYIHDSYKLYNASRISRNIICLPLYFDLSYEDQFKIAKEIKLILDNHVI